MEEVSREILGKADEIGAQCVDWTVTITSAFWFLIPSTVIHVFLFPFTF